VKKTGPYTVRPRSASHLPSRRISHRQHESIFPSSALAQPATCMLTPPPTPPTGPYIHAIPYPDFSSRRATSSPNNSSSPLIPHLGAYSADPIPANPALGSDGDPRPRFMSLHQQTHNASITASHSPSSNQQALVTLYNTDYTTPSSSPVSRQAYSIPQQAQRPRKVVSSVPDSPYGQTLQSTGWPGSVSHSVNKMHWSITSDNNGKNPPPLPLTPVLTNTIPAKSFATPINYDAPLFQVHSMQNPPVRMVYSSARGGHSVPALNKERPIPRRSRARRRVPTGALQQRSDAVRTLGHISALSYSFHLSIDSADRSDSPYCYSCGSSNVICKS
jgi:hypothetical protein